ncbi:GlxA family transcriptional regulator [Rhizobium skierniewicense]|uniref:GlxA family transcriptional regulator n=1 Tax=Rhizobium skierniewicense TaxID=984260 RepID=UPI00157434C4|nr:GlxA family transcriptional regulator [Rhizobium skierniewicense]NTF34309.1 GlxA family transcriptional regulator [Rhizobium skierniewicense]
MPSRSKHFPSKSSALLKVGFILGRSFTLSPFALFVDTLRLAGDELDHSGRILTDWDVLGDTRHLIRSSCGVSIAPTSDLVAPERFDVLVVVGGLLGQEVACSDRTLDYLRQAAALGIPLIGVCTGSFILAEAGLLTDHEACVSWLHFEAFRERFPELSVRPDRLFNFDGKRGSCAGGASAADLAAFIVRSWVGRDAERNALDILQIASPRKADDSQSRAPLQQKDPAIEMDRRVNAALLLMEQHVAEPISIERLAQAVQLSRRQLERLFHDVMGHSPAEAYKILRLRRANHLIVSTNRPLIDIALDVGFGSASNMGRSFRRVYGTSPGTLRGKALPPFDPAAG